MKGLSHYSIVKCGFIALAFLITLSCNREKKSPAIDGSAEVESVRPSTQTTNEEKFAPEIEDVKRTEWQNPDLIINSLGALEDKVVADIGAGAGYFAFKLAKTAKKVIALDIDPNALEYIKQQKAIVGDWSNNIETRLTPPDVPNLLNEEADVVLIVNTFSYIPNKASYFPRLLNGIKPGGTLYIVDFKPGEIPVGPADEHKSSIDEVKATLRKSSFKKVNVNESSLEFQYIISAQKK